MTDIHTAALRAELATLGLRWIGPLSWNTPSDALQAEALAHGEGKSTRHGGFVAHTGQHTGRSPNDKYIVRDATTEHNVWWDNTGAFSPQQFANLKADFMIHARLKPLYVQDLLAGANPLHELPTRIVTEKAWHALFMRHLLIEPVNSEDFVPELTIINLPSFKADPARHGTRSETVIAIDLAHRLVLIGGTEYAGEMKKAVFSVLNYLLPEQGILPMHCSANIGPANINGEGDTAIFFGLSGTGKTSLSADPERRLIGDDEHGWSQEGVFNIEGGCYAKAVNLSREAEPEIFAAATAPGTVLENVVLDANGEPDFTNASLTENTRAAYSLSAISNAEISGQGGVPKTIIMLTADAFGVLPPIAELTPDQAMEHFIAGYTAKVAGTERGVKEPTATFSACFGAPFLPRHPSVYGAMLRSLIRESGAKCYLVNTGWSGGAYGIGARMPIALTRAIVKHALNGNVAHAERRIDPNFGFAVPIALDGIDPTILDPRKTWADAKAYDAQARKLVQLFAENQKRFEEIPAAHIAAE
jgi:phosphoenolpyruvate carboxykinase (ATP)